MFLPLVFYFGSTIFQCTLQSISVHRKINLSSIQTFFKNANLIKKYKCILIRKKDSE